MPITRKRFSVPVAGGEPIRCILMDYPGQRREIYCAGVDFRNFIESQHSQLKPIPEAVLQDWELLQDPKTPAVNFYSFSVLPWLVEINEHNALLRDRIVKLIRLAWKKAETA